MFLPLEVLEIVLSHLGLEELFFLVLGREKIVKHLAKNIQNAKLKFIINGEKNLLVCRDMIKSEIDNLGNVIIFHDKCIPNLSFARELMLYYLHETFFVKAYVVFNLLFYNLNYHEQREFAQSIKSEFLELREFINDVSITIYRTNTNKVSISFESLEDCARFFMYCELYASFYKSNFQDFLKQLEYKSIQYVQEFFGIYVIYQTNIKTSYSKISGVARSFVFKDFADLRYALRNKVNACFCDCSTCYRYSLIRSNDTFFLNNFITRLIWRATCFHREYSLYLQRF